MNKNDFWRGKSILVTGGTGSLGKKLTSHILKNFPEVRRVIIYSRDEQKQFVMAQEYPIKQYPQIRFLIGDVRDYKRLERAMTGVDYVIHAAVFIIAELSANHNGNIEIAKETIQAAKRAGVDAIKLQTYTADTMTIDCENADFIINGTIWEGRKLYELYQEAYTPWDWHEELFQCAKEEGLICFSSPFDKSAVDFLEKLDVPAYKIASFEITDIPLIEYVASKGKPVILSTGIATSEDIELALDACHRMGNHNIALLKCTSSYSAPIEEANMAMIPDFKERFDVIPGLSDHTLGTTVPIVATTLGARIIEKHFIFDRSIGGPDASFSMNEKEFTEMVKAVREAEKAVGVVNYEPTEKQIKGRAFSRSLYVVKDIKKGEVISEENVRSIRLGFGLPPQYLRDLLGKKVNYSVERGTRLSKDMIDNPVESKQGSK